METATAARYRESYHDEASMIAKHSIDDSLLKVQFVLQAKSE